jgi:phosphonate transport system permease protein
MLTLAGWRVWPLLDKVLRKTPKDAVKDDYRIVPDEVKKQRRLYNIVLAIVAFAFVMTTINTSFNPFVIFFNMENIFDFIFNDMIPPNFGRAIGLWESMLQTVSMAFLATFVGGIISFCLCFLASAQTSPSSIIVKIVRGMASLQRNVPTIIWLFIFRMTFGIGITIGFVALLFNTVGFLVRMFAEVVDEVGNESMEALDSTGSAYLPKLVQCVIPAAIPGFVSWLLFSIEVNIRSAGIVGAMGGGGIGMLLMGHLNAFRYRTGLAFILALAAVTIVVGYIADYLREKVLST